MKDIQTEISLNNTRNQARNFTRNQNKHEQINQINTVYHITDSVAGK